MGSIVTNYPNARSNPAGSIPVYLSSDPKAVPIVMSAEPPTDATGPIPVRFVAAPAPGSTSTDQGSDAGALPVVISSAPNAMPVWDIGA